MRRDLSTRSLHHLSFWITGNLDLIPGYIQAQGRGHPEYPPLTRMNDQSDLFYWDFSKLSNSFLLSGIRKLESGSEQPNMCFILLNFYFCFSSFLFYQHTYACIYTHSSLSLSLSVEVLVFLLFVFVSSLQHRTFISLIPIRFGICTTNLLRLYPPFTNQCSTLPHFHIPPPA